MYVADRRAKQVDTLLKGLVAEREPGAAVLVARNGRVVYTSSRGVADMQSMRPIDFRTSFRLASLTKQFTAAAVMLLVRDGKLPHLARLIERGRTYDLATFEPMASPLLWTTIATGRTPVDHGVVDFQERDPVNRVARPITSRSRRVPALWNAASARGITVGVVGWWATWPAEKVQGFPVSDRVAPVLFDPETSFYWHTVEREPFNITQLEIAATSR